MPAPVLASLAKDRGISMERAEHLWGKAKKAAAKEGRTKDYAYITGIWKKMSGTNENSAEDLIDEILEGVSASDAINKAVQLDKKNPYLSVTDVASMKHVSRAAVLLAITDKRLPSTRVGVSKKAFFFGITKKDAESWDPKK